MSQASNVGKIDKATLVPLGAMFGIVFAVATVIGFGHKLSSEMDKSVALLKQGQTEQQVTLQHMARGIDKIEQSLREGGTATNDLRSRVDKIETRFDGLERRVNALERR